MFQREAGISNNSLPATAPFLSNIGPNNLTDAPPSYSSAMRYQDQAVPSAPPASVVLGENSPIVTEGGRTRQQGPGSLPPAYDSAVLQNTGQNATNTNHNNS